MTAGPPRRWTIVAATVAGLIALPVAAWWVIGDHSETSATGGSLGLDHVVEPLPLSAAEERGLGFTAVVVVFAALVVLAAHARRRTWDRRWLGPVGAAALAGVAIGLGWRVLTAGVIGANIGAGLVIMFGGPGLLALLVWAAARTIMVSRSPAPTVDVG